MNTEGGRIVIRTEREAGFIVIRVRDDGHGKQAMIKNHEEHKSIGTKNVRTRLQLLCGGNLEIRRLQQGTESVIRIPVPEEDPKDI